MYCILWTSWLFKVLYTTTLHSHTLKGVIRSSLGFRFFPRVDYRGHESNQCPSKVKTCLFFFYAKPIFQSVLAGPEHLGVLAGEVALCCGGRPLTRLCFQLETGAAIQNVTPTWGRGSSRHMFWSQVSSTKSLQTFRIVQQQNEDVPEELYSNTLKTFSGRHPCIFVKSSGPLHKEPRKSSGSFGKSLRLSCPPTENWSSPGVCPPHMSSLGHLPFCSQDPKDLTLTFRLYPQKPSDGQNQPSSCLLSTQPLDISVVRSCSRQRDRSTCHPPSSLQSSALKSTSRPVNQPSRFQLAGLAQTEPLFVSDVQRERGFTCRWQGSLAQHLHIKEWEELERERERETRTFLLILAMLAVDVTSTHSWSPQ